MLVLLCLLSIKVIASEWEEFNQTTLDSARPIAFSSDNQYFIAGGSNIIFSYESSTMKKLKNITVGGFQTTHSVFSKNQKFIAYVGTSYNVYYSDFPNLKYPIVGNGTITTSAENGTSPIFDVDKYAMVHSFPQGIELGRWPISNSDCSCEFSDFDGKFGWTNGKKLLVMDKDLTTVFYEYSNLTLPAKILEINFLKGDPYPIVLFDKIGIIKTEKDEENWRIIRIGNFEMVSMSVFESKNKIAIGFKNGVIRIFSFEKFQMYKIHDWNVVHSFFYEYKYSLVEKIEMVRFSKSGNNLLATLYTSDKVLIFRNCSGGSHFHWNCTEVCGDEFTYELECDLEPGVMYDGCTDLCTVEENFKCTVNSTTNRSICAYEGNISLSLIKIEKDMSKNEHTIILSIFPPLSSLKNLNLNGEELSKLFMLPPKFTALSYSFDDNASELSIGFSVTEEMEHEPFYIDFNPSIVNISGHFASKSYRLVLADDESSSFMPFYYSNEELISISKIISYFSVFIPIAGWILFFAGMFSKSLSGLETLMTFQFCGVTLHWLRCRFFMGLSYASSIKYLSGYNIFYQVSNVTTSVEIAQSYIIHKTFDIDLNFFDNNLNLVFLLCVPFLFAVFVVRISIFKQKRKSSKKNFNQSKLVKLKEYRCFALSSLLYSIFAIYIPFLEFFILFTETGQLTHVVSWVLSLAYFLLFVFVLLKFFRNPSNFEIFWSSFRLHRILLHHFFFYIFALTLATIFIIKLPTFPYLSAGPCILMFFYTLILRPYLSLKDNLRSAFNYAAMCCFLGFNIFVENLSSKELGSKSVYMFLVINLAIILSIVFLIALVSSVFHCYHKFYLIPKIMQSQIDSKEFDEAIINELNKANLEKIMKRMEQTNEYFNKILIPNENIFDYTNRLMKEDPNNEPEESRKKIMAEIEQKNKSGWKSINVSKKIKEDLKLEKKEQKNGKNEKNEDERDYNFKDSERILESFKDDDEQKVNMDKNENSKEKERVISNKNKIKN